MKTLFPAAIALLTSLPCFADPVVAPSIWSGTSAVTFHGTSTLHDFDGKVDAPLSAKVEAGAGGPFLSATSKVTIASMDTDNNDRDEKMRAMFQAAVFPQLTVEVLKAPVAKARPTATAPGALPVRLTICGTSKTIAAAVTNLKETADRASFTLTFPVSLAAYKLSPPGVLGGLIKVGDQVSVTAEIALKRKK